MFGAAQAPAADCALLVNSRIAAMCSLPLTERDVVTALNEYATLRT